MNREQKKIFRAQLFRHLDGIVTAPTAYCLHQKGILEYISKHKTSTLSELCNTFKANEGYLNVALHTLASQGWLDYVIKSEHEIEVRITKRGNIAIPLIPLYKEVVELIQLSGNYHHRKFHIEPFLYLEKIFEKFKDNYGLKESNDESVQDVQQQILSHIEGIIVGPTVVALGMSGMFHKYFMEASFRAEEFHSDKSSFGRLLDIFVHLDWFKKQNETYQFTEKGVFFARRASAYGVTVSYLPTFRNMEEMIFGNPKVLWNPASGSEETHVDRKMNVWGSGGAHAAYFKVVDEIIIDIFNQPIEKQPKGIVDMGCGNGAFLIHLYNVVEQRTNRGKILEEHPLFLVGADFNTAALEVSRENIIQANIWAKLIWGDIGQPALLAKDLEKNYNIQLKDLLNVRTFLDHNRIWSEPKDKNINRISKSTGAFAFRGKRVSTWEVEENLKEHFEKWLPYVGKNGLLVIELHTIPPSTTAANLGRTAATAYNATHGFSDQYIVEIDVLNKVLEEAGLHSVNNHFTKFPDSDLATVSIHLLKKKITI